MFNRASFHLLGKENLVKHQKVSKYYENDCRFKTTLITFQPIFNKNTCIKILSNITTNECVKY